MRTSGTENRIYNTVEERLIIWELDGGSAAHHEFVELFDGRLYTSRLTLVAAKLRAKHKVASRALAGILPFLFLARG